VTSSHRTQSPKEAQLLKRNDLLEDLWDLDNELREWHQERTAMVNPPEVWDHEVAAKVAERREISDELRGMGCKPWHFNPARDNSWLAIQRVKVSTGTQ
jgi:hypothetical protein